MNDTEFLKVSDIKLYVEKGLSEGRIKSGLYRKKAAVRARKGLEGEKIITVMQNGLTETVNTVKKDENGNTDWVLTASSGETYIISHKNFTEKYKKIEGSDDIFTPVGKPVSAGQIGENIVFKAPWGEEMKIISGGYLLFSDINDIYGVQKDEFLNTYEKYE